MASSSNDTAAPFPELDSTATRTSTHAQNASGSRSRGSSGASGRVRGASVRFLESSPPLGFLAATGEAAAFAPTITDIRRGSYANPETQSAWRRSSMSDRELSHAGVSRPSFSRSPTAGTTGLPAHQEEEAVKEPPLHAEKVSNKDGISAAPPVAEPSKSPPPALAEERSSSESPNTPDGNYPTGYRFPPKHTWQQATLIGLKAFWKFFITPFGFLIIIYGANIVAWGGMLFLLLIGGGKALCHPTCNDINSPRRKWIEIDSQILNALFCVTGFGLIPWRFRDLYYLMKFRLQHRYDALRQLAGINRSWFRLAGSENRPVPGIMFAHMPGEEDDRALPLPITAEPDQPLTGIRAPPTPVWKLDLVIWLYVWNTFLQAVLCGFMWGYNRYKRPSWSTGLFVALACIVAAAGGYIVFLEGKKVKKIEGVPWGAEDLLLDAEKGVPTAIEVQEKKEVKVEKKGGWLNKHKNVVG